MENRILCISLERFRNKCAAWQTQENANRLLRQLKKVLPEDEWWKLKIAHSHYVNGEGSEEVYSVCNELIKKYNI